MNKTSNYFLPITSYSMYLSELIIDQYNLKEHNNILLNPHGFDYNDNLWDSVVEDTIPRINSSNLLTKAVINYKYTKRHSIYLKRIKKDLEKTEHEKSNFYYVDLYHVLSNHIFSNYKFNNRFIVEDGILNYYESNATHLNRVGLKNFYYGLFGLSYKALTDGTHLTGIFLDSVAQQFVTHPTATLVPEKSKQIFLEQIPSNLNFKNVLLILGQEPLIMAGMPLGSYCSYIIDMILISNKKYGSFEKIIYKPHPRTGKKDLFNLQKELEKHKMGFEFYLENKTVEQSLIVLLPSIVFSFYSTALMSIKNISKDRIGVHAYLPKTLTINNQIITVFERVGIKIHNDV